MLRIVLEVSSVFLVGYTLAVVFFHARLVREGRARLLRSHIVAIAASYDLYLLTACVTLTNYPLAWWRACLWTPAVLLGYYGMFQMTRRQRGYGRDQQTRSHR